MVDRLGSCFVDRRSPTSRFGGDADRQRIFAIALGCEDLNDDERLGYDPLMAVLAGKLEARRADCAAVAGIDVEPVGIVEAGAIALPKDQLRCDRGHKLFCRSVPRCASHGAQPVHARPRCHG